MKAINYENSSKNISNFLDLILYSFVKDQRFPFVP